MCRVLGVSASGFYDWFSRPQSPREQANVKLLGQIQTSFTLSDRTYGSPRIVRDLRDDGIACSVNWVARLMHEAGLKARHKRRRLPGQLLSVVHSIAPNLLDRQFEATGPNQKWAADFTYVWTAEGWLFVAVVLDLYSRRVVGWSMQPTMTAQLVMDGITDGSLSTWTTAFSLAPLRPGFAIYQRRFPEVARSARHRMQHEPARKLLGQRRYGKFLLHFEDRTA